MCKDCSELVCISKWWGLVGLVRTCTATRLDLLGAVRCSEALFGFAWRTSPPKKKGFEKSRQNLWESNHKSIVFGMGVIGKSKERHV